MRWHKAVALAVTPTSLAKHLGLYEGMPAFSHASSPSGAAVPVPEARNPLIWFHSVPLSHVPPLSLHACLHTTVTAHAHARTGAFWF